VLSCVVDALPQTRQVGHEYLLGVDWGRLQNATACVVLDISAQPKAVVAVDRFMKLDYHRQFARIKALGTRFGVGAVVAERNAVAIRSPNRLDAISPCRYIRLPQRR
jgi:hypothetical protein